MDLMEKVAKALHDGWLKYKSDAGFQYGPLRDNGKKLHPHFVEWEKLDDVEAQNQDRFQAALIVHAYTNGLITAENLPKAIHNAWAIWANIHRDGHPHAKPYGEQHANGPDEHEVQAQSVWKVLQNQIPQIDAAERAGFALI